MQINLINFLLDGKTCLQKINKKQQKNEQELKEIHNKVNEIKEYIEKKNKIK